MTDATLVPGGGRAALRLRRDLPDPPSVVWQAITERNQLRAWFPCEVEVAGGRWEVGAALTFRFPPEVIGLTLTGGVVAVNEPTLLVLTWGEETLRFELSARGGGTRLVLIDELPPRIAARNAPGWEVCLVRLAGGAPGSDAWRPRFEALVTGLAPTLGTREGPPTGYRGD